MSYVGVYQDESELSPLFSGMAGDIILEFGNGWCGHCQRAQPAIQSVLVDSAVMHVKIADGRGKRHGRVFNVKLWPTLIRVVDGKEVSRVVRPRSVADVNRLFSE